MLIISNKRYIYRQKQLKIYFFPVVAVAVLVADFVDFFNGCVRFTRFFVWAFAVVSPVK
jgi:hypothetical protein